MSAISGFAEAAASVTSLDELTLALRATVTTLLPAETASLEIWDEALAAAPANDRARAFQTAFASSLSPVRAPRDNGTAQLAVPVCVGRVPIGALVVESERAGEVGEHDESMLHDLAREAARAVVRLATRPASSPAHQNGQHDAPSNAQSATPSGRFLQALLEGEEIQQILNDAAEAAARRVGADGAEIRLS
ncbi:MAG TPA: GAF domain-containing protein, partial [Nitrolancea sp.]|nr:GAF domain-containing protein [Nitrolancea sp.]